MVRDNITRTGAKAPGVKRQKWLEWWCSTEQMSPTQIGGCRLLRRARRIEANLKDATGMPGVGLTGATAGKVLSDRPALEPYRGKPAVRKRVQERLECSVGDRPTEAKVRSLVAWIAKRRETEFPKPIDKAILKDGEQVIGP